MTYNVRNGIQANKLFLSFTDVVRNGLNIALTHSQFTNNPLDNFFGAYYGNLILNSVTYSLVNAGFDSTGCSQTFGTQAYDTITGTVTATVTMTLNTTMAANAHAGKYVIIRLANGSKVFARIISNTASTLTLDRNVSVFGVVAGSTIALLLVPVGLTMGAFHRLDHIATNFTLTPPEKSTEDVYFLGSEDVSGAQNSATDINPIGKLSGSVTIRGGVVDLMRLIYGTDTAPTARTRYNLGSESIEKVSFVGIWTTNISSLTHVDAVTQAIFCNDVTITTVGPINSIDSSSKAEATIEFEVKANNVRIETITAQGNDTTVNV